jgi:hypothetical protein
VSFLGAEEDDLKLLCPTGDVPVMDIEDFKSCNWGKIPSGKVLARGNEDSAAKREDVRLTLLKVSETFAPGSKNNGNLIFNLFGPYSGNSDLLFKDTSLGLVDETAAESSSGIDSKIISDFDHCTTTTSSHISVCG